MLVKIEDDVLVVVENVAVVLVAEEVVDPEEVPEVI